MALKKDIIDYNEIVSSEFGKDFADSAWQVLVKKYPDRAEDVKKGDVQALISPGWLSINTSPSNANIRFVNIDKTYNKRMALDHGNYSATISAKGFFSKTINISIKAGKRTRLNVNLERGLINSLGMQFAYIQPGTFKMGSKKANYELKPVHQVTLSKGFYMQTTEVTQGQWWELMRTNPSHNRECGDNCPVETVSWDDAKEFIKRLNLKEDTKKYRLPTEAEWEYACRAESTTLYSNGNNLDEIGWYKENSGRKTHPVAEKKVNNWGLYDMHGNVNEWCEDWYDEYSSADVTDPVGPSRGANRVQRSGNARDKAKYCLSASRDYGNPERGFYNDGFRIVSTFE